MKNISKGISKKKCMKIELSKIQIKIILEALSKLDLPFPDFDVSNDLYYYLEEMYYED